MDRPSLRVLKKLILGHVLSIYPILQLQKETLILTGKVDLILDGSNELHWFRNISDFVPSNAMEIKPDHQKISIQPNPFSDYAQVVYPEFSGFATIEVRNAIGYLVYSEVKLIKDSSFILSKNNLSPGTYVLSILTDNSMESIKFVID